MDATQPKQRRSAAATWTVAVVVLLLCASAVVSACGDSGTTTTSPSAVSSQVAASPSDAPSPSRTPLPTPTIAGTIAFAKVTPTGRGFATGDIYVVRTDGTGLTRLAASTADECQPAWSPDGRRIAYAAGRPAAGPSSYVLRVMNADGSGKEILPRVSTAGQLPAWSPRGTQLAYYHPPRSKPVLAWKTQGWDGLVVVNAYGNGWGWRPTSPATGDRFAAYAPDGRMYFVRRGIGDIFCVYRTMTTRVTTSGGLGAFSLSPDGTRLVVYDKEHDHLVLRSTSAGGTPVVLVDDVSRYVNASMVRPAWSPDGTQIAFAASSFDEHPGGSGLYVINADGTGFSTVPIKGRVCDPAWQPE
jgi:Tol biopolymer transport system component